MADNKILSNQSNTTGVDVVAIPKIGIGSSFERKPEFSPTKFPVEDDKALVVKPTPVTVSLREVLDGTAVIDSLQVSPALDRQSSATLAKSLLDAVEKNPALGGKMMFQSFGVDKELTFDQAKEMLRRISKTDGSLSDKEIPDGVYRQFLEISVAFSAGLRERLDDYVGGKNKNISNAANASKIDPDMLRLLLPSESQLKGEPTNASDILKITLTLRDAEAGWYASLRDYAGLKFRDANGKLNADEKERLVKMDSLFKAYDGSPAVEISKDNSEIVRMSGRGPKVFMSPMGVGDPIQLNQYRAFFGIKPPSGSDESTYDLALAKKMSEFQKDHKLALEQAGIFGEETKQALDSTIAKATTATTSLQSVAKGEKELSPNGQFRPADLATLRSLLQSEKPKPEDIGRYDSALVAKVMEFQTTKGAAFGLRTDGVIDANTVKALTEFRLQNNKIALRPGREYPEGFVAEKREALVAALKTFTLTEFEERVLKRAENSKYPDSVNRSFTQLVDIFQRYTDSTRPDGILGSKNSYSLAVERFL